MATQKQKFNGNNLFNNRVKVDFINKKVDFKPIIADGETEKTYINRFYRSIFWTLVFKYLYIFVMIISHILALRYFISTGTITISIDIIIWSIVIGIITTIISLIVTMTPIIIYYHKRFKDKNFREEIYPELNVLIAGTSLFTTTKKHRINYDLIRDKKFIIPHFRNVIFNYKLYGDMAEAIESIEILPHFSNTPYDWKAIIEFIRQPRDGHMDLVFI